MFLEIKTKDIDYLTVSAYYDAKVYKEGKLGGFLNRHERRFFTYVLKGLGHYTRDRFDANYRILDAACGSGKFLEFAAQHMAVTGIDICPVGIGQAKQRVPTGEFCVGTCEALPFEKHQFDYITCFGSLEHFLDMRLGLFEMRRCLKQTGRLFLLVPNLYGYNNTFKAWLTNKTPRTGQIVERLACADGWHDLIENAGFKVLKVSGMSFHRKLFTLNPFGIISPLLNLLSNLSSMLMPQSMHAVFCFFADIKA